MFESLSFALGAMLLSPPIECPPTDGQIRFDGLVVKVSGVGGTYTLTGTLWDRDTNDAPSKGDLFQVNEVLRNGRSTGVDPTVFVLTGETASGFVAPFRAGRDALRAVCESRVEVSKDMPAYKSNEALTRFLAAYTKAEPEAPAPEEQLRAEMTSWADEICKQGKHVAEADLKAKLVERAGKPRGLPKAAVQGVAKEVAAKFAFACTRVEGTFTYE